MDNEYEIITHPRIKYIKPFIVNLNYRNSHLHHDFEICLILDGKLTINSKKEQYNLSKGNLILFNPFQPHELRAKDDHVLLLSLQVSHKFCIGFFPMIANLHFSCSFLSPILKEQEHLKFNSILVDLAYYYFEKQEGYEFKCMSLVNDLYYYLLQYVPHHFISNQERAKEKARFNRINRILRFIEENYSGKLLLSTIAEQENLSLSYLSHLFKNNLNMTFQEYVKQVRFDKAKQLVAQTNMKLIDICMETGFSDTRYLNQMFNQAMGCTPGQYRDQHFKLKDHVLPGTAASSVQHFLTDNESVDLIRRFMI